MSVCSCTQIQAKTGSSLKEEISKCEWGSREGVEGEITPVAHLSSPPALMSCRVFTDLSFMKPRGRSENAELHKGQ